MSNQFLKLRRSAVPGKIPTTSSLEFGEIALNTYDGLAFMKKSGSNGEEIIPIGQGAVDSGSFATTGSNTFIGDQTFSGSLFVTGSITSTGGFTGSLKGTAESSSYSNTASYAERATSASYATTASYVEIARTASYIDLAQTASYVLNAVSSSYSVTSSYALNISGTINSAVSSSYSATASYAYSSLTASYVIQAISSSYSTNSDTASYVNLSQTASYSLNAVSSSYSSTSSWAINALTASSANNFIVRNDISASNGLFTGTITAQKLIVQIITSSIEYVTGSTIFGSQLTDTHQFTGSVNITGSLTVNGQLNATSSYSLQSISASFSSTASFAQIAQTASYVIEAVSASFASTASFVNTSSWAKNAVTASYVENSQTSSYSFNAISSSYSLTASYALNAGGGVGFPYTGSAEITGSLSVTGSVTSTGGFTGSLFGTSSWAENAITASYALNAFSASYAANVGFNYTASYYNQSVWVVNHDLNYRFVIIQVFDSNYDEIIPSNIELTNSNTATVYFPTNESGYVVASVGGALQTSTVSASYALTASYLQGSVSNAVNAINAETASYLNPLQQTVLLTGSMYISGSLIVSGSGTLRNIGPAIFSGSVTSTEGFTGSLSGTSSVSYVAISSSYASTASFAPSYVLTTSTASMLAPYVQNSQTGSFLTFGSFGSSQTISGSLVVNQNLTVLGTQSVQYITSSQLDISTNIITVNTATPGVRFGGFAVYDSGSTGTGLTGSLLWDSLNNRWIYSNPSGSTYDGGMLISGPKNTSGLGSEVGTLNNVIVKGQGGDHITSSQITDDGTTVSIPGSFVVTGSSTLNILTGSLFGTSSWSRNVLTASYISSLNKIGDVISYTPNTITDGYQLAWNSGSQVWAPAAGAAAKGATRLFVSANRNNANAFYFASITVTADSKAAPAADTAFMITSTLLSKITLYLREDAAGSNSVIVDITKNANGTTFASATASIANITASLSQNTIQTYSFTNLTLNQFDSIHVKITPTSSPGQMYGILTIE